MTLYSASGGSMAMITGQAARFVIGGLLMLLISRIPPSVLRSWTPWLYAASVALLLVVAVLGQGVADPSVGWISASCRSSRPNCSSSPCR